MIISVHPQMGMIDIAAENDSEELDLFRFDDSMKSPVGSKSGVRTVYSSSDKNLTIIFDGLRDYLAHKGRMREKTDSD